MKRLILAGLSALAVAASVAACNPGGGGGARQVPGEATDLVDQLAERGRLPQRDYVCRLTGGEEDQPYGTLGLATDRYTLIVKGGGREEGSMTVSENRAIDWDGDLGTIDDNRRVRSARVNSEGTTIELSFDFSPVLDGHGRMVCTAEA